jgi:hypothetical protein
VFTKPTFCAASAAVAKKEELRTTRPKPAALIIFFKILSFKY